MGFYTWTGDSDGDFNTVANWYEGVVPGNGDSWAMNHLSVRSISTGLNQSAKTFVTVHQSEDCSYDFGLSGTPLQCGITSLRLAGKGRASYLQGNVARLFAEASNKSEEMFHLDGEVTDVLSVQGGAVHLDGTHEFNAGVQIMVGKTGVLTVSKDTDLTTNSVEVYQADGELLFYANVTALWLSGGNAYLHEDGAGGSAAITTLHGSGSGRLFWESGGSITNAYMKGSSILDGNVRDMVRTLGAAEMHDDARIMLKKNRLLTLTTGIRAFGKNSPELPAGSLITIAA